LFGVQAGALVLLPVIIAMRCGEKSVPYIFSNLIYGADSTE
jgi:hypothetical protein